jgi:ribosomal protein L11 methylase PrmA
VNKNSIVYDIGCGDGRIVLYAAKAFGAHGVGIDIDPVRIDECKANAKRDKVESLTKFILGDATKMDISKATVVTLYLLPESNELLRPKFEKDLKPGTLVVSHNYVVPGWEEKEIGNATVIDLEKTEHSVFLYKR